MKIRLVIRKKSFGLNRKSQFQIKDLVEQNKTLGQLTYIAFFFIMFIGMFDGILELFFGTSTVSAISFAITVLLYMSNNANIERKYYAILLVGILVTLLSYLLFLGNLHYDITTTFKNTVIMTVNAARNILLFGFFFKKKLDKVIVHIIEFYFIIEMAMYFLFLYVSSRGGTLEQILVEIRLIKNWQGRFHGSFAEPMTMGFYLGFMLFFILIYYESKWKYIVAAGLLYILMTACRAKFAMIALPLALIVSFFTRKKNWIVNINKIVLSCAISALIVFVVLSWINPYVIFNFVASNFGNNASFTDRFYFLVASLRQGIVYPFGTGYGLNFEYYYKSLNGLLHIVESAGLDTVDLRNGMVVGQQAGMNGKETISYLMCCYGLPGVIAYIKIFSNYYGYEYKEKKAVRGLLVFVFLESMITIDILMGYCIPFVLVVIMIMNTCKIQKKQYK